MLFLERIARALLVIHAVSAAVLVGATTHHLVWLRGYFRRDFRKYNGERRFALIAAIAFALTFTIGNLIYPTYKVRVRAEYFDNPAALAEDARNRRAQHAVVGAALDAPPAATSLSHIARLFDIKEHWVAFGCAASLALLALSRLAHPREHGRVLSLYLGLAMLACGTAWFGAIVGLLTASYRAVGS